MPINVTWDDTEKTTLLYSIEGRWTWDEFYEVIYHGREMMDSSPRSKIYSIIDVSQGKLMPSNALSHFARISTTSHPKMGLMVMVGMGSFVRSLMSMLNRYKADSTSRIRVAQSLDEARGLLVEYKDKETGTT